MITYGSVFDLKEEGSIRRCVIYDSTKILSIVRAADHEAASAVDRFMRANPNARIGVLKTTKNGAQPGIPGAPAGDQ
ncbi:MAG TPA: hypothetical protein VGR63_02600 [Casimicrobiaceae bacterium]|nr:hypothetical protein [Casimicrobiaceae bacterium]